MSGGPVLSAEYLQCQINVLNAALIQSDPGLDPALLLIETIKVVIEVVIEQICKKKGDFQTPEINIYQNILLLSYYITI